MVQPVPSATAVRARAWLAVRLACYVAVLLVFAASWGGSFSLDDAYITLANARVLLTGADPYYGATALTGATSGVHLAVLALLGLFLPLPVALITLCAAGGFAYLWGIDLLARKAGATGWKIPVLAAIGFTAGMVPHLLMNGLETGLGMAAAAWLLVLADDRRLAVLAGIAPYIRPELGLLAGLLMLRQMWGLDWNERTRRLVVAAFAAAPWAIWYIAELGTPLPNTMSAKLAFYKEVSSPFHVRIATLALTLSGLGLLPALLGCLGLPQARSGWVGIGFLVALAAIELAVLPGALRWNWGRYLATAVPVFLAGLAALSTNRSGGILIVVVAALGLTKLPDNWRNLQWMRADYRKEEVWTRNALAGLPAGSVVMVHDAGLPAWVAPRVRLVDFVGLKTPFSTAAHRQLGHLDPNWGKAADRIGRHYRADYLLTDKAEFWDAIAKGLRTEGWKTIEVPTEGTSKYHIYALTRPEPDPGKSAGSE